LNWDAIGAIGEVTGAVAVFVTLAYLAVQIRQNTHSVSTSIYESAMSGFNDVNRLICENAELSSIFRRGSPDPTSLDEEELFRFNFITRNYTNHIYKLFRLYERGAFPENEWKNVVLEACQLFSLPGMARFKENNRYFADLWKEMDRHKLEEFSSFDFGDEPRQRN
jgi:hypothetical protein